MLLPAAERFHGFFFPKEFDDASFSRSLRFFLFFTTRRFPIFFFVLLREILLRVPNSHPPDSCTKSLFGSTDYFPSPLCSRLFLSGSRALVERSPSFPLGVFFLRDPSINYHHVSPTPFTVTFGEAERTPRTRRYPLVLFTAFCEAPRPPVLDRRAC